MQWKWVEDPPPGARIRYSTSQRYPVGDLLVPGVIEAEFQRPELSPHAVTFRIEMTFHDRVHPTMTSVTFHRVGTDPIRTADLRVPLAELEREAILAVAPVVTNRTATRVTARTATTDDEALVDAVTRAPSPSKRWQLTPEHLAEVVRVYREGELTGRPVMHVAEHFDRNRPTASRWIQKARDEGYFDDDDDDDPFDPEASIQAGERFDYLEDFE